MRVLLVSLNSKFVHSNLAIRYLREVVKPEFPETVIKEFSINEPVARITGEIFEAKADVIGFSCYIWNLSETLAVIRRLRPVLRETKIVLGGPEVSFEESELLLENPGVDVIVTGEGEIAFLNLLKAWKRVDCLSEDLRDVKGIVFRTNNEIIRTGTNPLMPLSELPIPYVTEEDLDGRLVYVETSRGCPFNCQYCLSSTFFGVRFLEPERFREMLRILLKKQVRTIKFVDRTFNAKKEHAFAILNIVREEAEAFIQACDKEKRNEVRVHCEMAGELLDQEWVNYLKSYPKGLLQLEIGVQSTYEPTLEVICRPQHFDNWKWIINELRGIVPLHLDLIAGLPKEGWGNFRESFNSVYSTKPDVLQLGFLKVLKGSGLRAKREQYGLIYTPDPPYEILETMAMSHAELLELHRIEDILEKYFNSHKFKNTLNSLEGLFETPFNFYQELAEFWQSKGWFKLSWSAKALFGNLWEFIVSNKVISERPELMKELRDNLRFDYYLWERPSNIPFFLEGDAILEETDLKLIKQKVQGDFRWSERIPAYLKLDKRQWFRVTAVDYFHNIKDKPKGWYLFFYGENETSTYIWNFNT